MERPINFPAFILRALKVGVLAEDGTGLVQSVRSEWFWVR